VWYERRGVLQQGESDDERFMALALAEAEKAWALGEVPVGAVVVHEAR